MSHLHTIAIKSKTYTSLECFFPVNPPNINKVYDPIAVSEQPQSEGGLYQDVSGDDHKTKLHV